MVDLYYPSGWMGDGALPNAKEYVQFDDAFTQDCHSPPSCISARWQPGPKGWAGMYWQYPDGNWGEEPGCNLVGATSVAFWARGDQGGEVVQVEAALTGGGSRVKSGSKALTKTWQQYTINVQGHDLRNVVGAIAWIVTLRDNPNGLTFYLDDMQFVGISAEQVACP